MMYTLWPTCLLWMLAIGAAAVDAPAPAAPPAAADPPAVSVPGHPDTPEQRRLVDDWFKCVGEGKPDLVQVTAQLTAHPELARAWSTIDPAQPWASPQTALHLAVSSENMVFAQLLIDHHADPDAEVRGCTPPLMWCNDKTCDWLIAKGAHPTIFWYANKGNLTQVQGLLRTHPDLLKARDLQGDTVLHWAMSGCSRDVADALIAAGADVNAIDASGHSVLDNALAWDDAASREPKRQALVDDLLAHGAHWDAYAAALHGNLAALTAELDAHPELLRKRYGVDMGDGAYLIHQACVGNHQDCVELLLKRGQDIEAKDVADTTPLHEACIHGSTLVAWLLAHGADPGIHEKHYGADPHGWAQYFNNKGALAAFAAVDDAAKEQAKAKAAKRASSNF
jgi:ankyrin repeat protein